MNFSPSARQMLDASDESEAACTMGIPVRGACLLGDARHTAELLGWCIGRRGALTLEPMLDPLQLTRAAASLVNGLLVLDASHAELALEPLRHIECADRPEVIVIGLSSLDALRLRERGLPLLIEVPGAWSLAAVVLAIEQVVRTRLPLRALARALVGPLELSEAVTLLRYSMFVEALARAGSKRAAARLLGVTRPAIQQMAKGYSERPADTTEVCSSGSGALRCKTK